AETPRGFTGHEHLDAVGLIHMNGRVYDPVLGRFLSADPFVPSPTATQSFNRYSYVGNNPLSYTDPTGLVPDAGEMGPHGQSDNDGRASTGSAFGQNPDNRFESPDTFGQQTTVPGGDIPGETDCNCYGGFGSQGIFAAERDALEQGKRTEESIQADVEKSREYEGHSGRNGRDYAHGVQVASGDLFSSEDIYDGSRLNGRRGGVYSAPTLQLVDFDVRDRPGENELDENAAYWAAGVIGGVVALAVSLEVAVALGLIESSEIVGLAAILAARKVARKYAARILGKALEAAGFRRPADHAAHHIVAFNATLASPARAILQRFGIGINAAENGVFLHQTLHNGMHTIRYYTAVNNALRAAARSGRREDVVQALDRIRQGLINGTFP
ncbi:MAG: RHS repeat-associated core domain-containing protein, partial [Kiloniellales bacterium]|nr:RHS repeat-associated core domain-containing protein [Kiloniellales bacterium]